MNKQQCIFYAAFVFSGKANYDLLLLNPAVANGKINR